MSDLSTAPGKPEQAPGCFGSAVAHCLGTTECSTCPHLEACGVMATASREKLAKSLGADVVLPKAPKPKAPKATKAPAPPGTDGLPKKAGELVRKLHKRGFDLTAALRTRTNPFVGATPAYMEVVMAKLLDGGFNRAELREAFMKAYPWDNTTASSHVSLVIPALIHLNAAVEQDGRIVAKEC